MVTVKSQPKVCISILNWNSTPDTVNCIQSLRQILSVSHQIVVLDNGSEPSSIAALQGIKNIEIVLSPVNLGFAGGHNKIMNWALDRGFDYVWLLNNDAISQSNCLERLVEYAETNQDCALVSPVLLNNTPPHAAQHIISILNDTKTGSTEYTDISVARQMQEEHPNQVIIWGTALLVRLASIRTLGLLDEGLFAYAEDTDYALRAISCGFRNAVVFDAYVWHENPPHPRKPHYYYYTHRNSIAIAKKHAGRLNTFKLVYWNLRLAKKQLGMINNKKPTAQALKLGIWHGWTNRNGEFKKDQKLSFLSAKVVQLALFLA